MANFKKGKKNDVIICRFICNYLIIVGLVEMENFSIEEMTSVFILFNNVVIIIMDKKFDWVLIFFFLWCFKIAS